IGRELVPNDDQGEFNVGVVLPRGTSLQRIVDYTKDVEGMLQKLPEVQSVFTNINNEGASYYVAMTPLESRTLSQQDLMRQARNMLVSRYPGTRINVSGGTDISGAAAGGGGPRGGGGGNRLQLLLQGPDIDQLQQYVVQLKEKISTIPGVVDVDSNFEPTQQELRVVVDRVRAGDLGVQIDTLATNLRTLIGGEVLNTQFSQGDQQYEVLLRLDEQYRGDLAKMGALLVPTLSSQRTVRLSDVAQLKMAYGPSNIQRYNRQRQITINAGLDKLPLGDAVAAAREKVLELKMKPGYSFVFTGSAKDLATASNDFVIAILLAVAFIYMVLASQFNSFVHPLTIMTALPL